MIKLGAGADMGYPINPKMWSNTGIAAIFTEVKGATGNSIDNKVDLVTKGYVVLHKG